MEAWRAELYHFGIKGQHWGVRRGPPYPLNEHASLRLNRSNAGFFSRGVKKTIMDRAREKYADIGDSGNTKSIIADDAKAIAEKLGFHLKQSSLSVGEDIKTTNPEIYKHQSDNRWRNNCTHSVVAFAARRRGLDVVATPMTKEQGEKGGESIIETCRRYFKGSFSEKDFTGIKLKGSVSEFFKEHDRGYEKNASEQLTQTYRNAPNGSYGMTYMMMPNWGHVFVWYKENGRVKFADSQCGINANKNFENIAKNGYPCLFSVRLDDRELNPDRISEAIKSASEEVEHGLIAREVNVFKMEPWRRELYSDELYHYGIKGMRWGVRRYQNRDGTLTAAGRKRKQSGATSASDMFNRKAGSLSNIYGPDGKLTDEYKKKKQIYDTVNSYHESRQKYHKAMNQAHQDSIDDFKSKKDNSTAIAKEGLNIGNESLKVYDRFASRKKKPSADLSGMTDKELQQRINRLNMEQQYRRLTESNDVPKGRQFVEDVLSVGGSTLAVTSSALAIALSIKQLRGSV